MTRPFLLVLVVLVVLLYLHCADGKGAGGKCSKDINRMTKNTRFRQSREENGASTRKLFGDFRKSRCETSLERPRKPGKLAERDLFEELILKKFRHDCGDKQEEESDLAAKLEDLLEKFDLLAADLEDLQEKTDLLAILTLVHGKRLAAGAEPRTAGWIRTERKVRPKVNQAAIEIISAAKKLLAKAKRAGLSEQELVDLMTEIDEQQNLDQHGPKYNFTAILEELKDPRTDKKTTEQPVEKVQIFREGVSMETREGDSGRKLRERLDDHVDMEPTVGQQQHGGNVDSIHADIERRMNSRHSEF